MIAFIGFFVSAGGGHGYSPKFQKYFVYLFVLGLVGHIFIRGATLGTRREIRAQETGRRPRWPFRYYSRLTEGLQGQRLMSFIGGMRQQPRFSTRGFSATVPMVRLSVFSNGVRLGPSSSLLSMSIITWEARFDELDVIQAIGRLKGLTTGILFRKSQSHEWVIFWTTDREQVFTALEHMGIIVSREPVHLRVTNQLRASQFVEDEVRPSEPSVLGAASAATVATASPSGTSSPLTFAAPLSSDESDRITTAPEDRKWPGVVVAALITVLVVSTFALLFNVTRTTKPTAPSGGGDVTTTVTIPKINTAAWHTSAESDALMLPRSVFPLPNEIESMRYDNGVTAASFTLVGIQSRVFDVNSSCISIQYLANDAPSTALSKVAADLSAACSDLVRVDDADLSSSGNKWTAKLSSDDEHWVLVVKHRLSVFKERLSS
jgi:hypothetical protein